MAAHRALAADDWEPLVQLAVSIQRMFQSGLSYGILLTIQCSEHMDFDVDAERSHKGAGIAVFRYRLNLGTGWLPQPPPIPFQSR